MVDGSTLMANIAGIYAVNTDTFPFVPADDVQPTTHVQSTTSSMQQQGNRTERVNPTHTEENEKCCGCCIIQ